MPAPYQFAADVVRPVCERLRVKAAELRLLIEGGYPFEECLNWVYLA